MFRGSVAGGLFLQPHIEEIEWTWKKKNELGTKKIIDVSVDAKEYAKALKAVVLDYMKNNNLDYVTSDGSGCGHTKEIKELFESNGITLYPLARETECGFPPASHEMMPLEGVFAALSHDIGEFFSRLWVESPEQCTHQKLLEIVISWWPS